MNHLYFECFSGISGDMTVAALLDLGADRERFLQALQSLPLPGYQVNIGKAEKCGIAATDFHVILDEDHTGPSHTHQDASTVSHHHEHLHVHAEEYVHAHQEDREHLRGHEGEHDHAHEHRGLNEIFDIIDQSAITSHAKELSKKIFTVLARAEGAVHGKPPEEVHFHEVGAVDSIVDIVSAAILLDMLRIDSVSASPLHEGQGHVWCQHGRIPVPAPATLELCRMAKIPLKITESQGEMVTPTGAAILATLCDSFAPFEGVPEEIGIGAGKKDFAHANVLRVFLSHDGPREQYKISVLETNVDDSTGEQMGYAMEKLFEQGDLDVSYIPAFMKKNRPGYQLTVMCRPTDEENITRCVFENTTSIGLRARTSRRYVMERSTDSVETHYGKVEMKKCRYQDVSKAYPEYESVKKCAELSGATFQQVYEAALCQVSSALLKY